MIQVKFKNLERSELTQRAVRARIEAMIEKFPDLGESKVLVTLEMENSRTQPGPDLFKVKIFVSGGRYRGTTIQKADSSLYVALAEVVDHLLERLNRFGDKHRVRERAAARKIQRQAAQESAQEDFLEQKMSNE